MLDTIPALLSGLSTLCVILGPFEASDDCAKNKKVAVRISRREMIILCKLAILKNMDRFWELTFNNLMCP